MPNSGIFWTPEELARLAREGAIGLSLSEWKDIAKRNYRGRSGHALRTKWEDIHKGRVLVPESPYPRYDKPLVMEGDALVLNDLEAPFHHAGFVNRCLELADKWGIRNLVLGGDALHNEALSRFDPAWQSDEPNISPEIAAALAEITDGLPKRKRDEITGIIEQYAGQPPAPDYSEEIRNARKVMDVLAEQFDSVHLILGNHEGRYLNTIGSALFAGHILTELHRGNDPRWKAAPYYFGHVVSGGVTFRISHPKPTAKYTSAWKMASKYQEHFIMGHNHHLSYSFDISGQFYAIESGCCVDEERLPYAAQRDNSAHKHVLGAVLIRGGFPWLLHERCDFARLAKT